MEGATILQCRDDGLRYGQGLIVFGCIRCDRFGDQRRIGRIECDVSDLLGGRVAAPFANPDHVAGGYQLIKHGRMISAHSRRKHGGLPDLGGQRHTFELFDDTHQTVNALIAFTADRTDSLTVKQESLVGLRADRFDGVTRLGKGPRADTAKDVPMQPLLRRRSIIGFANGPRARRRRVRNQRTNISGVGIRQCGISQCLGISEVACKQIPLGMKHIEGAHSLNGIDVQIGNHPVRDKWTMRFGIAGHSTGNVAFIQIVPEGLFG